MQDQKVIEAARNMVNALEKLHPDLKALQDKFMEVMGDDPRANPQRVLKVYSKMYTIGKKCIEKFSEGLSDEQIMLLGATMSGTTLTGDEELDRRIQENLRRVVETNTPEFTQMVGEAMGILIKNDLLDQVNSVQ